jgi:hypothetical protein
MTEHKEPLPTPEKDAAQPLQIQDVDNAEDVKGGGSTNLPGNQPGSIHPGIPSFDFFTKLM